MRLIADEHVSPRILRILRDLALNQEVTEGWTIESATTYYASVEDEDWTTAFARSGGHGLISADREMLQRPTLIRGIADTDLIGVYVRGGWAGSDRVRQAAHILYWWPRIREIFMTKDSGSAWIVPKTFDDQQELREVRPFGESIESYRSANR